MLNQEKNINIYLLPSVLYLTNVVLSSIKASTANFSQYNDVITAMVGWSYPVNLGMLFTIFTSVHTQKKENAFNARTLYIMFNQRKTNDITTGL